LATGRGQTAAGGPFGSNEFQASRAGRGVNVDIVGTLAKGVGMSWEALNLAATDRRSGSARVAAAAADALAEISGSLSRDAIVDATRILVQGQPVMAAVVRLADDVLRALDEDGPPGAERAARAFTDRLASEATAIAEQLVRKLPRAGSVLTVSASSTVLEGLCRAAYLRVVCAVSEPGGEGRVAAERLRERGVDAIVVPDGAVAQQSTRVDAIVFGADVVGPAALLNKTGTLAAALGARASARPCLAVAGETKFVDDDAWPNFAAAVERLAVEGVPAFEEIPAELITTFVTNRGPMSQRVLRRAARAVHLRPDVMEWLG
jgi:translation initiation factor 2B subunit (eIF-2B alpha/beta/delta family)